LVTSRDVAAAAGVSQATVSRVLLNSSKVTEATRQKVLEAMASIGYAPNAAARAMKTQRAGTVGVVVARITNPYYPELIQAISSELALADVRMVLWTSEGTGDMSALQAISEGMVDGVIFTTVTEGSAPLREALKRGAAVVTLNRSVEGLACDQVTSDNWHGSRSMAQYFGLSGHQRVAFIGGPAGPSTSREREQGFRAGVAACGLRLDDGLVRYGNFSHEDGRLMMRDLLAMDDPPTAVFCVNDLTALGAIDGARSMGVRVPEDVWVAGYDDIPMAAWEAFDLTTVRQPVTAMAALAVQLLLRRREDPDTPVHHHRYPSEIIVRGSTAHKALPSS
jgi:LacI family transcriptional regulator